MRYFLTLLFYFGLVFLPFQSHAKLSWDGIKAEFNESLQHASYGKSDDTPLEFGHSRLIAARTGIKGKTFLATGLEIVLKPNWILKQNKITVLSSGNYKATVLTPFRPEARGKQRWDTDYANHVVFPIILTGEPKENITLSVRGDFEACPDGSANCLVISRDYHLPLSITESYPTVFASTIEKSLLTAAVEADEATLKMENTQISENEIILRIIFPKTLKFIELQPTTDFPFKIAQKKIEGNVFSTHLILDKPITLGNILPINMRCTFGSYQLKVKIADKPLSTIPKPVSLWIGFWSGIFLMFLSPFWAVWLCPQKLPNKTFAASIRKIQTSIAVSLVALLGLWHFGLAPSHWIQLPIWGWGILALTGCLCMRPMQPIWVLALLLFILPKPFWNTVANASEVGKIGLIIWWGICLIIPFNIWILCQKSIISFFKNQSSVSYHIVMRIPYFIMFGWLSVGLIFPIATDKIEELPKDIKHSALIQIVPPVCFRCALNQIAVAPIISLPIYQMDSSNPALQKWHLKTTESGFVLLTPKGQQILLSDSLSPYQLKKLIVREIITTR